MVHIAFKKDTIRNDGSTVPRQVQLQTQSFDKVLNIMGKTTGLSEVDMRSVFNHFVEHLVSQLSDGYQVQTPMGTFSIGLRQRTDSQSGSGTNDNLGQRSVSTDKIYIRVRPARALIARLKAATEVQVIDSPSLLIPILFYADNTEEPCSINKGKPGDVVQIVGKRLSFAKTDPTLGVFFVASNGAGATRAPSYSHVGSARVDCKIPSILPGIYRIELRSKPTKTEIRTGTLNLDFTVI